MNLPPHGNARRAGEPAHPRSGHDAERRTRASALADARVGPTMMCSACVSSCLRENRAPPPACRGVKWRAEVRHGREMRTSSVQLHGGKRRTLRQVLQRALQAGGKQDGTALRLPARRLSIMAPARWMLVTKLRLKPPSNELAAERRIFVTRRPQSGRKLRQLLKPKLAGA
jgi:hypothetical protein